MYSEALSIMDRNTVYYMIDELKEDNAKKDSEILKKDSEISNLKAEIELLVAQLKEQNNIITTSQSFVSS